MPHNIPAQEAPPVSPETLDSRLRWRYAVKAFDPARKIPPATWSSLEEALVLSPSSFGLQTWKFFVVDSPDLRKKLLPVSWGQSQIVDADRLVVFARKKDVGAADVERFVENIKSVRGTPPPGPEAAKLDAYKKMMLDTLASRSPAQIDAWSARQVYIALGNFLTSAALLGVDACPMEGFDPSRYDEILGLPAQGYLSTVAAAAGYRAPHDAYAQLPKVRFPTGSVVAHL
jgi:nitroreductase